MKKRILACLLALVMLISVMPVMALAEDAPTGRKVYVNATKGDDSTGDGTQEHPYKTVGKALTNIENNATVYLADGVYYAYTYSKSSTKESDDKPKYCKGQNVTFIGEGPGKTTWYIGTPWSDAGGETNGDYSFDGANSATFQNMTLKASMAQNEKEEFKFVDNRDWTGFIRINHTIVKDCVIEGRTAYWGYQSSEFINTVFNASKEKYGYALWYYTGTKMSFDDCTFNVNAFGNTINLPNRGSSAENPLVLNFKDCTVNASNPEEETKQALNIHDSGSYYVINFSGKNVINGLSVNDKTCSRLFQVEVVADGYNGNEDAKGNNNQGYTAVKIDGKTVWTNGKMVAHAIDTANDKYTDGYKDNAFTVTETGWVQQTDGSYKWMVTRVCKYCGYEETVEETKRDDITAVLLPALQANTDDHYSYLIGYADGTVRPNGKITRAEVATIFFRLLDDDTRAKYWSSENNFSDVSADKWYNNAVSTLSRMGVIGGYADGTFRPDAPISRAEFAKIAVSFTQNNGSAVYNYFTDVKTTDWFAPYVTAAKDAGLIEGYSDGSFKPESKITRAEACAIVNRTLGRKPSKAHMKISDRIDWPDVQTTDWFYEAIMEATNSHTYQMGKRVETWNDKLPQRDWAALETGWANAYTGNGGEVR